MTIHDSRVTVAMRMEFHYWYTVLLLNGFALTNHVDVTGGYWMWFSNCINGDEVFL